TAVATLNLTGGTFTSNVDILEGGGATTSTINISGGTLDMKGHNIGSATALIDNLVFASGGLMNVAQINNGAGLTKTTTGTLTLANAAYTGATAVQAGTLKLSGYNPLPNSATINVGSGAVLDTTAVTDNNSASAPFLVAGTQTLTNNGTVTGPLAIDGNLNGAGSFGNVTIDATGIFSPGNGGFESASTTNLTLGNGATLSFVLGAPGSPAPSATNSNINIGSGALTLGANTNILYVPAAGFAPGTYHLANYGTLNGSTIFNVASIDHYDVTVATTGANRLDLTIAAPDWGHWVGPAAGGTWNNSANWSGTYHGSALVPNMASDVANFTSPANAGTIALDAPVTLGQMVFNSSAGYTIGAPAGTNGLTLDNGLFGNFGVASINVLDGQHTIAAGVTLDNPTVVTINKPADALTISGEIDGTPGLTLNGSGTLTLNNSLNTFGGVTVNSGTLAINSDGALGADTATLTFAGTGGTLKTLAGMTIARDIAVNTVATIDTNGANPTITGNIAGPATATLTKVGAGVLTLGSPTTYGGALAITGGTVLLTDSNALQNATLTTAGVVFDSSVSSKVFTIGGLSTQNGSFDTALQDNTSGTPVGITLRVGNNNASTTYSGNLTGPGTLNKVGTGTLDLTGNCLYTGGTILSAGQLNLHNSTAFESGPFTITGGILDNLSGSTITLVNPNQQTWGGNFTFVGTNDLNLAAGNLALSAASTVTVGNPAATLTVGAMDAATFNLTKMGAGKLVFTKAIVNGGRLEMAGGSPTGTIEFAAGSSGTFSSRLIVGRTTGGSAALILDSGAGTVSFSDDSTVSNYIGLEGASGAVTVNGGTLGFSGPSGGYLFMDADGGTHNHNGSGSLVVNAGTVNVGVLLGMSNVRAGQPNPPTQALDGVSTLTINGGQVNIGTGTPGAALNGLYLSADNIPTYADGQGAGQTLVTVNLNGGTLSLDKFVIGAVGSKTIYLNGGTLQARSNDAPATAPFLPSSSESVYVKSAGAFVDTQAFNISILTALSDDNTAPGSSGGLTKTGTGTLTLGGYNTYYGSTVISAGTLTISNDANLGTAPNTATANKIVINSNATLSVGDSSYQNTLTLNDKRGIAIGPSSGSGDATINVGALQTLAYAGVIANHGGTGNLIKTGPGTLDLSGINSTTGTTTVNTYSGTTTVLGGILRIGDDRNLGPAPVAATAGRLVLNGGTLSASQTLTLNANRGIAVGPASGSGSGGLDVVSGQMTYNGIIANNGAGTGGLTKTGSGTLALSNVQTYTGPTTISGGTLALANGGSQNTIASSSSISIGGGATLDVSALSGGTMVLAANQGLAAPGSGTANITGSLNAGSNTIDMIGGSAGTLAISGGMSFNNAQLRMEVVNGNSDGITIAGAATSGGNNLIDLMVAGTTSGTYTLINAGGGGLNGATYTLRYLNRTNWVADLTPAPDANTVRVTVSPSSETQYPALYWKGGQVLNGGNVLALSDINGSNWTTDPGLTTISPLVPGAQQDVYFPAASSVRNTVLGADMSFKSITIDNAGGSKMTIGGSNTITVVAPYGTLAGITANESADINSNLALGNSQTWTTAALKTLSVGGNVDLGSGSTLTIDGAGDTRISGVIGVGTYAPGALVKNGAGALTLGNSNLYTYGTTLNAGTLNLNNPLALGSQSANLIISGGTLGNTSGNPITLANTTNNSQYWNGSFAFAGPDALNMGTAAVNINNSPTVTVSQSTLTLGGIVNGSPTTANLVFTKDGPGTLVLAGTNSWTGNTLVHGGTLQANTSLP
ncbi:MAG: autotransporter-associated beta strand repeat-containing protein, partial [Tepidisphaeraceae bacterium]